jgi:hypothetical protein
VAGGIGKVEHGRMDLLMDIDLFSFYLLKIILAKPKNGEKAARMRQLRY